MSPSGPQSVKRFASSSGKSAAHQKKAFMINQRYKEFPGLVDGSTARTVSTPYLKLQKPWVIVDLQATVDVKLVRVFNAGGSGGESFPR